MAAQSERTKEHRRSRERARWREGFARTAGEVHQETIRTTGEERRSTISHKASENIREREASESARIASRQAQSRIAIEQGETRKQQRIQTQEELNSLRNRQRAYSGSVSTVTRSSVWSTVVMVFFLMFGMIAIYVLVTNGSQFGAIAGTVGNFIHGLSSNTPLFVENPKSATPAPSVGNLGGGGSGGGGGAAGGGY